MTSNAAVISSFIEGAPPGELADVVADVKSLTQEQPQLLQEQEAAFKKYNEEQFATVRLPGAAQQVVLSPFNQLPDGRYFDVDSSVAFEVDHATQRASGSQSWTLESQHSELIRAILKTWTAQTGEHFPSSALTVCPHDSDAAVALVLVANKYSPNNFWNGRWRASYSLTPSTGAIEGSIKVDVHYYEDGNVRLLTEKAVAGSVAAGATAAEVVRQIASIEKRYQEDLNRAFTALSEGAFKNLRRQLPVTRQKVDWDKIGGYRLGQDIGGGRSR